MISSSVNAAIPSYANSKIRDLSQAAMTNSVVVVYASQYIAGIDKDLTQKYLNVVALNKSRGVSIGSKIIVITNETVPAVLVTESEKNETADLVDHEPWSRLLPTAYFIAFFSIALVFIEPFLIAVSYSRALEILEMSGLINSACWVAVSIIFMYLLILRKLKSTLSNVIAVVIILISTAFSFPIATYNFNSLAPHQLYFVSLSGSQLRLLFPSYVSSNFYEFAQSLFYAALSLMLFHSLLHLAKPVTEHRLRVAAAISVVALISVQLIFTAWAVIGLSTAGTTVFSTLIFLTYAGIIGLIVSVFEAVLWFFIVRRFGNRSLFPRVETNRYHLD